MDWLMLVLTAVFIAALYFLLRVSTENRSRYAVAKGVCSGLFVLCALLVYLTGPQGGLARFLVLLLALLLCAGGDVLLGVANRVEGQVQTRPFMMGAGLFSAAHLAFVVFFLMRSAAGWDIALLIGVLLMVVLRLLESRQLIHLEGKHQILGYIYTFLVGIMAGMELIAAYFDGFANTGEVLLAVGVGLFFLSDVILLFLYYGSKQRRIYRPANLVTYYAGMWLIALSAHWL